MVNQKEVVKQTTEACECSRCYRVIPVVVGSKPALCITCYPLYHPEVYFYSEVSQWLGNSH